MNFLSTVFFVVLTIIGIHNVYAPNGWEESDVRNALSNCYLTFMNKVGELAKQPMNFDDQTVQNELTNLVHDLFQCIHSNNLLVNFQYDNMPLREKLRIYYMNQFTEITIGMRKYQFETDCPSIPKPGGRKRHRLQITPINHAGTSSRDEVGPLPVSAVASRALPNVNVPGYNQGSSSRPTTGRYHPYSTGGTQVDRSPPGRPPSSSSSSLGPDQLEIQLNEKGYMVVRPRSQRPKARSP